MHQSHRQATMTSSRLLHVGFRALARAIQINHSTCRRQPSKRRDSLLSLLDTDAKVLVTPLSCLRRSDVFFALNSIPTHETSLVGHSKCQFRTNRANNSTLGVIAHLSAKRLATVNLTTELTFHCDSFGVINPLSTTASNQ